MLDRLNMIVDENGFKQIDELIENAKERLRAAVKAKAIAFQEDTNTWHDNAAYDDALEKENSAIIEINRLIDVKNAVEIISKHNDANLIDIGDTVTIEMNGNDVFDVILTGKYLADAKNGEVTLNSPIGEAIFKKKANDEVYILTHNKTKQKIKILSIVRKN